MQFLSPYLFFPLFSLTVNSYIYIYLKKNSIPLFMSCPVSDVLTSIYKFRFQTHLHCFTCLLFSVQNLFMPPLLLSYKCCLLNPSFPYASSYCFFLCHQDSQCQGRCWLEPSHWETRCPGLSHLPCHACNLTV